MSARIRQVRNAYCEILEKTRKGTTEIAAWLEWFPAFPDRALDLTEATLSAVFRTARFRECHFATPLNDRQRLVMNTILDAKWAKLTKCSQDPAHRRHS